MTFFNEFYSDNYGAIGLFNTINHAKAAQNTAQIAASQRKAVEEQQRIRQSQERMEADNREANQKMLELEKKKHEEERRRLAREESMRHEASNYRQLAAFAIDYAKHI